MTRMRNYQGKPDYLKIRQFLQEVFLLNDGLHRSWDVARFDYWLWHVHKNIEQFNLEEALFIWEDRRGKIAAVLNPEGSGEAFLHVHPGFRTRELEDEMVAIAETHLAETDGTGTLIVWADREDDVRRHVLQNRGFAVSTEALPDYRRHRSLETDIPPGQPPEGYVVRSLGGVEELPARSQLSWRAFHPEEPEEDDDWTWYLNVQRAPLYRRDLDIVACSPDGDLASFCTVWFDKVTRSATFEPVGTDPLHQRKGLATAVMCEGMRRARRLGANVAHVGSWGESTHRLYRSVGFIDYHVSEPWSRSFIQR